MFDWLFGARRKQMEELAKQTAEKAQKSFDAAVETGSDIAAKAGNSIAEGAETATGFATDVTERVSHASTNMQEKAAELYEEGSAVAAGAVERTSAAISDVTGQVGEQAQSALEGARAQTAALAERVSDGVGRVVEQGSGAVEHVQSKASDAAANVTDTVNAAQSQVSETAASVADSASGLIDDASSLASEVRAPDLTPVSDALSERAGSIVDDAKQATAEALDTVSDGAIAASVATAAATAGLIRSDDEPADEGADAPTVRLAELDLAELDEMVDQRPVVGKSALAVAPPMVQAARVTKVQAGGRRIVAVGARDAIARRYARRSDGTYWLDGAPDGMPSRLIVGAKL